MSAPLDRLVDALAAAGCAPKVRGDAGDARCPAHDDHKPSLHFEVGREQPVVLTCHAGCDRDDVLAALRLTWADVCAPTERRNGIGTEVARYRYENADGAHVYDVVRFSPKTFRPCRPDGTPGLGDTPRILYRLPEVVAAVAERGTVWLAEGEKDADALARAGVVATSAPFGAGSWRDSYSDTLAGAGLVVIVADQDAPGARHALDVAVDLGLRGIDVQVVQAATGRDAADHLAAGHGVDEFEPVDVADLQRQLEPVEQTEHEAEPDGPVSALDRMRAKVLDTSTLLNIEPPEPLVDGLLDRDSVCMMIGTPGAGKTFVAIDVGLSIAAGRPWQGRAVHPGPVLYVAAEGARGMGRRVAAWLAHHGAALADVDVKWYPEPINVANVAEAAVVTELVAELRPVLVVVDTLARCAVGADENSAKDAGVLVENLDRIRRAAGSTVLAIHHVGKNRAAGARGSSAFHGAVTSELSLEGDERLLTLRNTKQREGPKAAPIHLALAPAGESVVVVPATAPASHTEAAAPSCVDAVAEWFRAHPDDALSQTQAVDQMRQHWQEYGLVTFHVTAVRKALDILTVEGVLTRRAGQRGSKIYQLNPTPSDPVRPRPSTVGRGDLQLVT